MVSSLPRWIALAAIASCLLVTAGAAAERVVDFRYGIPTWHQPLGVPDDWHKPMASERGALLYDFGPGPYVQGLTVVELTAEGAAFSPEKQVYVDSARTPFVRSTLRRGDDTIEVTTFAVAPERAAASNGHFGSYERLDGIAGVADWAKPGDDVSPEFRNVAWGITRPIEYRLKVPAGAAKRVMLGFCESYKKLLFQRTAVMNLEGAPTQTVDLALNAPLHQPQVFLFDARDADGDGWIDVSVFAPQGQDPNATLATIAVYPAGTALTRAELIAGRLAQPDRAELRVACGTEMAGQSARTDVLHAAYAGRAQPELAIKSKRRLTPGKDGVVQEGPRPFLVTQPAFERMEATDSGWRLTFPAGTQEVTARVFSGDTGDREVAAARASTWSENLEQSRRRWGQIEIPFDHITVGDPAIQAMIDSSLRTLYQGREVINDHPQFNSSFSLYRGIWAGDAIYITHLADQLGDSVRARQTLDALFSHQRPDGIIDELHPQQIHRTTAEVIWAVERDAQISGDWEYARAKWPQIVRGVTALRALRDQTLHKGDVPYAGMFPPGFSDGGILDIGAEYSTVYCAITGISAAERIANHLGHPAEAAEFRQFAGELLAAFDKNRRRDQRRDARGNLYLPVRVGLKGDDPVPQLTQWAVMDAHLYGEGWLPSDHELVRGSLALLESVEKQGLPVSLGWMPGGNWVGMGMFYGMQSLITQRPDKTADVLYAAANHASRVGTWVEEQSLVGQPLKLAGDQPHEFAATMMPELTGSMLAYARENTLHLLGAVPAEWLRAGAVNQLKHWRTAASDVSLRLAVAADGRSATLEIEPITPADRSTRLQLHTASLVAAGFALGNAGEVLELTPGTRFVQTYPRK